METGTAMSRTAIRRNAWRSGLTAVALLAIAAPAGAGGRLTATGGLMPIEGSAGGGLVPWAVLAGTGTEDEIGGAVSATGVVVDDLRLESYGAALAVGNRVEVSFAHQRLEVTPLDERLRQNVVGLKLRLYGDLVYGRAPQLAAGAQYKHHMDFDLPRAVGADDDHGVDAYLAASKLFIEGPFARSLLVNGTLRATRANELGLLGFGGDRHDGYRPALEASAAIFLTREVALGYEYRQKPDNLRFAHEHDWHDAFLAYFPSKHVSLIAAYAHLGEVAGLGVQDGVYVSVQAGF
jgi:hypothetical protein